MRNPSYRTLNEPSPEALQQEWKEFRQKQLEEDRKAFNQVLGEHHQQELLALPTNKCWPSLQTYLFQMVQALNERIWNARDMDEINILRGQRRAALAILHVPEEMREMIDLRKATNDEL